MLKIAFWLEKSYVLFSNESSQSLKVCFQKVVNYLLKQTLKKQQVLKNGNSFVSISKVFTTRDVNGSKIKRFVSKHEVSLTSTFFSKELKQRRLQSLELRKFLSASQLQNKELRKSKTQENNQNTRNASKKRTMKGNTIPDCQVTFYRTEPTYSRFKNKLNNIE